MPRLPIVIILISFALLGDSTLPSGAQPPAASASDQVRVTQGPNTTIGLIGGGPESTNTRIAADMAQVLDDGDRLRILPILGTSSVQNIADLIFLKGVDVAIVRADVLTQTLQRGTIPRETSIQYIAKLFPEEIHILARKDVANLSDLNGKVVAIGPLGSGTEMTASALLDTAHITPNITHDNQFAALERLRQGEISAMFVIGGEPVPLLQAIEPGLGLHFVPIPLNTQLLDNYLPTTLDHKQYPNLVPSGSPVDTVAVGSILVTLATPADTARAKRVNHFVDLLFERIDQFRAPEYHPKWQEVNLAAQLQGLARYPEVQTVLRKDQPVDTSLRNSFGAYLNQSGQSPSGMTNERREALFRDFLRWRDQHSGP